jgi:GLPGLI family protein
MRTLIKIVILFCFISTVNVYSQESKSSDQTETTSKSGAGFEGVITYEISFPGLQIDERAKALMPKEMKLFLKEHQQRLEMSQTTNVKSVTISDSKNQSSVILMDMMDKKLAMRVSKEEVEKELAKTKMPQIVYSNESKIIAGYKCKKAELVTEDGKKSVIYYTEDLQMNNFSASWNYQMPQLKGFPLEFEMEQNGTKMKMTATRVSKELIPITLFMIPEGYQEVTREQLQGAFGSGGGK